SIDTGTKVAECTIGNTGSFSTYKKYKAPVPTISGSHDVYLKFVGAGTNKLFQLKWISFSKKSGTVTSSLQIGKSGKLSIYPNPAKNKLFIFSGFLFNTVEIFSMNGQKVFQDKNEATQSSELKLNLDSGMYVLRVSSENDAATSNFLVDL
ncbi:MAG: T9SS type A sorting domain-containing protein, partial [Bacteroidota bacterium]|nr:T9SS type A sorting domain-containing protein [Bacteroidota bacterium]